MANIIIAPFERKGELHIFIQRQYLKRGTNGQLFINGRLHCHCIELPWKENKQASSCIPEGVYRLGKRRSNKYGKHIQVMQVKDRELILIHPANNAMEELKGCIAPVTTLTGPGQGSESRKAFLPLLDEVYAAIDKGDKVRLTIFGSRVNRNPALMLNLWKQLAAETVS